MTMTDTEAKALAIRASYGLTPYESGALHDYIEATEARHAAELREQAERFSEVLGDIRRYAVGEQFQVVFDRLAAPFILPAPDPLVEALGAAVKAYIAEHGIEAFKALPMFGSARIGEAGE